MGVRLEPRSLYRSVGHRTMREIGDGRRFPDDRVRMIEFGQIGIRDREPRRTVEGDAAQILADQVMIGRVVDDLELQRAKNQIEAAHIFEQDSNFRQAMLLGEAETVGAGWRKVGQFVERTRAVTAQDIQRVATQYLTADARTTGILLPQPPQPQAASSAQAQ